MDVSQRTRQLIMNDYSLCGTSMDFNAIAAGFSKTNSMDIGTIENKVEAPIQHVLGPSKKEHRLLLRCWRLMKEICHLKNRNKQKTPNALLKILENDEDVNMFLNIKFPSAIALLLQGKIKKFRRSPRRRRWTVDEKVMALRMYQRSPTCYRLLRRLFYLPTPTSLKVLLGKLQITTGINNKIFSILSKFVKTLMPSQNHFVLMWDEMSIRRNLNYNQKLDIIEGYQDHAQQGRSAAVASHALVFMIAGIQEKVKQPIAFYFSGGKVTEDKLALIIKDVLKACFDIKLNITATVCDPNRVNKKTLKLLGATVDDPTIKVFNKVVVTFLNAPYLLKSFRNLFLKYDIECPTCILPNDINSKGVAKWAHIQDLFNVDNNNPVFVFAPALRPEHLNPNRKQKRSVNLAAQVMDHTVAVGLHAKVGGGELPKEALVTAYLVKEMEKLFDALNADSDEKNRGRPLSTNLKKKSQHINHLNKMKSFFIDMKLVGCQRAPPTQENWIWTINAVQKIWLILTNQRKYTIYSLATRRLQKDPIEVLFAFICEHCGSKSNPTVAQFVAGFKTSILPYIPDLCYSTDHEADSYSAILNNFKQLFKSQTQDIEMVENEITQSCEIVDIDDLINTQENISEIQACEYVCRFIIKKIKNKCDICSEVFLESKSDNMHLFVSFKEYDELNKSEMYASKTIIMCVEKCANFINTYLEHNSHKLHIYTYIKNILNTYNFDFLNKCEQHKQENKIFIIKNVFYICVKRFCMLENRKFMEEASRVALKTNL